MSDRPRTAAQAAGDRAETHVATTLERAGWSVLGRNVHVGRYELDIVAIDPGPPAMLVVLEVRWRASRDFGLAEETVDHRKRVRVRRAAYGLLDRGGLPALPLRFDLVVVEPGASPDAFVVRHHRAAF